MRMSLRTKDRELLVFRANVDSKRVKLLWIGSEPFASHSSNSNYAEDYTHLLESIRTHLYSGCRQ